MTAKVGLVTVLYNSVDVLPDFFASLANQRFSDYWLYVIDNSPDEGPIDAARKLARQWQMAHVTFVRNDRNLGVATGNNQGIKLALDAGSAYVLLLNNDIVFPDADLIGNMVAHADATGQAMMVPKIFFHDSGHIWCAGGQIDRQRGTTTHRGEGEQDRGQYDRVETTNYAPTCFMLIKSAVFHAVGLMDEKYFVYYDDTDFVWRAQAAGYGITYWPAGQVWHKVSSSTGGYMSPFSVYYSERNRIYFIRKHFRGAAKIRALAFYLATRPLKWRLFSRSLRPRLFAAVVDGFRM
jgi:GT2 family glycosyltransferase